MEAMKTPTSGVAKKRRIGLDDKIVEFYINETASAVSAQKAARSYASIKIVHIEYCRRATDERKDSPVVSEPFFCRQTDQAFCEIWIDHKKRDSLFA
ncbi:hypothetical protein V1478_005337 [Vespula squamosa]|uniref:Uncharacterized protein n=1 Tax=Vespula squamosa TaxID=30214 RepID=A0ABD2BDV3_VESSQ